MPPDGPGDGTPTQPELPGMPRRLFAATPTRLLTWLDCPRRYRMTYLERPTPAKGPPWAHNSLGAAVHTALHQWYALPVSGRTPEAAGRLLEAAWLDDGFRDDEHSALHRERARQMVEDYVATLDPEHEPVGVERSVAVATERLALRGRADRIDERPTPDGRTELVIVDYKTGRRPPGPDEARASLALAVYAAAASRTLHGFCRTVELHHLPTGEVAGWQHTQESLGRHLARAESIGGEAAAAEASWRGGLDVGSPEAQDAAFPANPGSMCAWCDFVRVCAPGRAVAQAREPWSGVDD